MHFVAPPAPSATENQMSAGRQFKNYCGPEINADMDGNQLITGENFNIRLDSF